MLASNMVISCVGFRVLDNLLSTLQADAKWECVTSNELKSSLINSLSSHVTSSIFPRTSAAWGTASSWIMHSSVFSLSADCGQMHSPTLSLTTLQTALGFAVSI